MIRGPRKPPPGWRCRYEAPLYERVRLFLGHGVGEDVGYFADYGRPIAISKRFGRLFPCVGWLPLK